ncbi:Asp23/Gls24 family envelope stress response protein [Natroniella sulfidigena]|uniref:Asp23/Gls24 family envelope stress response protein n=1 Tax=Natroniella sulfidigena TaxID=723921 RepID=UPI00200B9740|nr:Asp23/Gls24 family envelope stress response protein [Natroniella sulfidigena]MCK8818151.1 Asp23/Gls24 family envelope stress response protein [Natroniella sulfidigena]
MPDNQRLSNELGTINISEEVISIIAALATMECYGLVGMAKQGIQAGLSQLLGSKSLSQGVNIEVIDQGVKVDLFIIVEYGVKISEVANNIIERVKYSLEKRAGVNVLEVNINVQGVRVENVT